MADYTIISETSSYIIKLLRNNMCPDPILLENSIDICSPENVEVGNILGLYLYEIREEGKITIPSFQIAGSGAVQMPPKAYTLYYMLFVNTSSQTGKKDEDIQRILGRSIQVLNDNNIIYPSSLQNLMERNEPPIIISQLDITLDQKIGVWKAINKPYQLSMFYKTEPIFLSSRTIRETPLVTEAAFDLHMADERLRGR